MVDGRRKIAGKLSSSTPWVAASQLHSKEKSLPAEAPVPGWCFSLQNEVAIFSLQLWGLQSYPGHYVQYSIKVDVSDHFIALDVLDTVADFPLGPRLGIKSHLLKLLPRNWIQRLIELEILFDQSKLKQYETSWSNNLHNLHLHTAHIGLHQTLVLSLMDVAPRRLQDHPHGSPGGSVVEMIVNVQWLIDVYLI